MQGAAILSPHNGRNGGSFQGADPPDASLPKNVVFNYLIALAAVAVVLVVRLSLVPITGLLGSLMPFVLAITFAGWRGGFGPAVLATLTSAAAGNFFFLEPVGSFIPMSVGAYIYLGNFVAVGIVLSFLSGRMRRLHDEVRARERQYATLVQHSPDLIFRLDPEYRFQYVSPAIRRAGISAETLSGRTAGETGFFSDGLRDERLREIVEQAAEYEFEVEQDTPGGIRSFHVRVVREPGNNRIASLLGIARDITERKRAAEAAARSDAKLRLVADTLPALITYINKDLRYEFVNKAYEDLYGVARSEILGKPISSVAPKAAIEKVKPYLDRALRGESVVYEEWVPLKTGVRFLRGSFAPEIRDGKVCGFAAMVEDLTAKKLAEEAVERTELRFRRLIELSPFGIAVGGFRGTVRFANDAFLSMIGYSRNELQSGRLRWDQMRPADWDAATQKAELELLRSGVTAPVEREYARRDGTSVPLLAAAALLDVTGDDPHQKEVVVFVADLTELKTAERKASENESRLQLALSAGKMGAWEWDLEAGKVNWSPSLEEIHGLRPGEFEGTFAGFLRDIHPDDSERVLQAARQSMADGSEYNAEYRIIVPPNGAVRWIEARGQCFRGTGSSASRMAGVCMDITDRKHAEDALRAANENLRRLNDELRQFSYAASHDLKEPLRHVSLYAQLLARQYQSQLDETGRQYIRYCVSGAQRMYSLIQDLLAYIEADSKTQSRQVTAGAEEALAAACENLKGAIEDNGAQVTHDPLPTVPMHPPHLVQVLQNLVGNALKYASDARRPEVHVSAGYRDDAWTFAIKDNGIGIAEAYRTRIFEVFNRINTDSRGTGIGLAICKKIVEHYGGRIWVESDVGQGSTFFFTVPKRAAARPQG